MTTRVIQLSCRCKVYFTKPYPLFSPARSSTPMKPSHLSLTVTRDLLRGMGAVMRTTVIVSAICFCLVGLCQADNVKAAIRKSTNIPAEELGSALQTLAKDYDFQVLYRTEIVSNLRTQGAIGEFTPDDALKKLLSGTGLTYKYLDEKTVTIV